jgi:aminoacyl-tRNA hydrolase
VLYFVKAAWAERKIVVIGSISDYTGNSDRAYVSVARQALAAADEVVFIGSRASKSLKAKRHPTDALQAFPSVAAAGAHLREFFRRGDLVLLKGTRHDHLEELISSPGTAEAQRDTPPTTSSIQAVVGLGNPGARYRDTPHNVGQVVLDSLAQALQAEWVQEEHAMLARIERQGRLVYLIKPLAYVNASGPVVLQLAGRLNFSPVQSVLVHDDMDLPLGAVRARLKGSDGGHRGVGSIQKAFGSDAFRRVKIGVGRAEQTRRAAEHVLTTFAPAQMPVIERACHEAAQRVLDLLELPAPAHPSPRNSSRDRTEPIVTAHERSPDP